MTKLHSLAHHFHQAVIEEYGCWSKHRVAPTRGPEVFVWIIQRDKLRNALIYDSTVSTLVVRHEHVGDEHSANKFMLLQAYSKVLRDLGVPE